MDLRYDLSGASVEDLRYERRIAEDMLANQLADRYLKECAQELLDDINRLLDEEGY